SFNLSGDLTTVGDANFAIDNSIGGMIGADAVMNVSAASISAGGALSANIFNGAGGSIVGGANLSFNLSGDLTTVGDANFTIDNFESGMIGAVAATNVSATGISTVVSLDADINNFSSFTFAASFRFSFNLAGDLTTVGDATLTINNSTGGMIGADAGMNVSA